MSAPTLDSILRFADAIKADPDGYRRMTEALATTDGMDDDELLAHMDGLYGHDNLPFGATHEQILEECRRQVRRDFGFEAGR